jgi:uncharacterized protein
MPHTQSRITAVLEVIFIFLLTFLIIWALQIPSIDTWKSRVMQRPFLEYIVMIVVPLAFLVTTRRNFTAYGISVKNYKYHLDFVAKCFIPVALARIPFAFLNWTRWDGALLLAAIQVALLFVIAWALSNKRPMSTTGMFCALFLVLSAAISLPGSSFGKAIVTFIFFLVFLGPGEEILFRGYIQSRLNVAFDRPYRFFGVNWGWGIIITSLMFGCMHILNPFNPFVGAYDLIWWWGFWTFFSGLVYGFIREKTGSVAAPAILHGLPQAIAYTFLGL